MSSRNETKILRDLYNKSRMMGDYHVRFCERFRGEIPLYLLDIGRGQITIRRFKLTFQINKVYTQTISK